MSVLGPGYSVSVLGEHVLDGGRDPPLPAPGDLVRIRDGPPELVYCWPRGEWGLWISELEARHGNTIAVVLDFPRVVDFSEREVDNTFFAEVDLVVDPSPYPPNKTGVRVMMSDGWVGNVWLAALSVPGGLESQAARDV